MSTTDSTQEIQIELSTKTYIQTIHLAVPHNTAWEPERAQQLISSFYALSGPIALVIKASPNTLKWSIELPESQVQPAIKAIYGSYPGADVAVTNKTNTAVGEFIFHLHGAAPFIAPLRDVREFGDIDPLVSLLTAMGDLAEDETITYSLSLKHAREEYYTLGEKMSKQTLTQWWHFLTVPTAVMAMTFKVVGAEGKDRFVPTLQKLIDEKLGASLMETNLAIKVKADNQHRAMEIIGLLGPALALFERESCNFLVQPQAKSFALVLSAPEIAALWHLPTDQCQMAGIYWAKAKAKPLPVEVSRVKEGIRLGSNTFQGKSREVRLPYPDRATHINIVGRTGVGKSTFMHHLIHQDIANGKGVAVIDPHGALVQDILRCSIPEGREQDVILLDMNDHEFPMGLNLLAGPSNVPKEEIASRAVEVIRKMFEDNWHPGRMERALYAAIMGLMNIPGSTLMDVDRLFYDSDFRAQVIAQETDPVSLSFWLNQYNPAKPVFQSQIAEPIVNRITKFYQNPTIRNVICQPASLDVADILARNRIFLANLGGISTLERETLGALLVSKFQIAAMSQSRLGDRTTDPYFLYVDEVQHFSTTSLPQMFSEARKFGLSLVVANQYLKQLEGGTLDAVMGNVGTTVLFQIGPHDAPQVASFFQPHFTKDDLVNLSRFHAVVRTQIANESVAAFSLQTDKPLEESEAAAEQVASIRTFSRETYALPRAEVEKTILDHLKRDRVKADEETTTDSDEDPFLG
ncbi:MAG: type IV secretion system DNA-binding domain-containing protein [Anaerolineales bacterium]|nr:type IV secretion system DNA-binding domain-containing protein [Anaerolineales bacterium]